MDKNNSQLINQSSGKTEYFTQSLITDLARDVLGRIDLDPASSDKANTLVGAHLYYIEPEFVNVGEINGIPVREYFHDQSGLNKRWFGKVWMNHPFGSKQRACKSGCAKKTCTKRGYHLLRDHPGNGDWINKLVDSYENGDVTEAIMICYASTSENWFKPLLDYPKCWVYGRLNYLDNITLEEISGVTKGSVITYFGDNIDKFHDVFNDIGSVHIKYERGQL
jgi:hypothetical protein